MNTTSMRFLALRGLGAVQILAALGLGIALLHSHRAYRVSIAPILPSATASLTATAEVVSQVATEVHENQTILDNLAAALDSYGDLTAQSKTSAQEIAGLLPAWEKSASDMVKRTKDLSRLMTATANKLDFEFPTGLELDGLKPKITYSPLLGPQVRDLRSLASETDDLSANIATSWAALSTNAAAMSQAFLATCDTTARLLAGTKETVTKLKKQDLGPAVARLNDTSASLRSVAQGVGQAGIFLGSLFYLGLALAASVGISGLATFLLVSRPLDTTPPPQVPANNA